MCLLCVHANITCGHSLRSPHVPQKKAKLYLKNSRSYNTFLIVQILPIWPNWQTPSYLFALPTLKRGKNHFEATAKTLRKNFFGATAKTLGKNILGATAKTLGNHGG